MGVEKKVKELSNNFVDNRTLVQISSKRRRRARARFRSTFHLA